jgi:hypothetical protein
MFHKDFLNDFRAYEEKDGTVAISKSLSTAWSIFIAEFCRSVSYHWKNYLLKIRNRENATFHENLSTSDEAFAMWVVFCKYDEANSEAVAIKTIGLDKWKETKKKKRAGPHDSKEHMDYYVKFYNQVKENRKNSKSDKFWQDMFFDDLFQDPNRSSNLSTEGFSNQAGTGEKQHQESLSIPGIDEEFLPQGTMVTEHVAV